MRCDSCEKEIPDNVSQCPNCGRKAGMVYKARNWNCPSCGEPNGPELPSCWSCGSTR